MSSLFLEKAFQNEPPIYEKQISDARFGNVIPDSSKWFQYRFEEAGAPQSVKEGDSFYIDFGDHYTGYLSFDMFFRGRYPDAPIRVRIKFAENLYELGTDFDKYEGVLTPAWLQEEILNIDEPGMTKLPRRYAFRYIKFTVEAMQIPVMFRDFTITAVTSADTSKCKAVTCDPTLQKLDQIGCKTLEDCMQRIYEDGPKRDRRLWLGDLRLQALTGYYTHCNLKLVRKCMYLFAAYTDPGCRVPRDVYENSRGSYSDRIPLTDYALMFPVTLCDYYEHTKDADFVDALFEIADEQVQIAWKDTDGGIVKDLGGWWTHIDWCNGLYKVTSMQGVFLYTLDKMIALCRETKREKKEEEYAQFAAVLRKAAKEKLYDSESGFFVNNYDAHQLSQHSQVWMVLGNVVQGEEAKVLMQKTLQITDGKRAVSPYMHHYIVEALIHAGMQKEALDYIKEYWGAMVECGADTYWEVFVPGDFSVSPYRNPIINSSCHAWSCSVSYFIRKYFSSNCLSEEDEK